MTLEGSRGRTLWKFRNKRESRRGFVPLSRDAPVPSTTPRGILISVLPLPLPPGVRKIGFPIPRAPTLASPIYHARAHRGDPARACGRIWPRARADSAMFSIYEGTGSPFLERIPREPARVEAARRVKRLSTFESRVARSRGGLDERIASRTLSSQDGSTWTRLMRDREFCVPTRASHSTLDPRTLRHRELMIHWEKQLGERSKRRRCRANGDSFNKSRLTNSNARARESSPLARRRLARPLLSRA